MDVESKMVKFMQPLFGEMADKTVELQKRKLGIEGKNLTKEDYEKLVEAIGNLCKTMAGDGIANKIHNGLTEILEKEMA